MAKPTYTNKATITPATIACADKFYTWNEMKQMRRSEHELYRIQNNYAYRLWLMNQPTNHNAIKRNIMHHKNVVLKRRCEKKTTNYVHKFTGG